MSKYVIKRILFLIPTVIGVTLIIYFVMNLTPGNPARAILGTGVPQADIDAYNHAIGYDLPFLQKFVNYLVNMFFHGDFGISYVTKQPVFQEIWPRYIVTMKLAFTGMIVSTIIGIPLGICAAVKQIFGDRHCSSLISFLLAAVPTFVLGLVLLFVFSLKLMDGYLHTELPIGQDISCRFLRYRSLSRTEFSIHKVVHVGCNTSGLCKNSAGKRRHRKSGNLETCIKKCASPCYHPNRNELGIASMWGGRCRAIIFCARNWKSYRL